MRVAHLVGACIGLATATSAYFSPDKYDFGNLPRDHILWGEPEPPTEIAKRATSTSARTPDPVCTNGANTRSCWTNGFSVATDFDAKWPVTGVVRKYSLSITNTTCSPDGNSTRTCLLFNNQFPGPTLTADWGDQFQITVTNNMQDNATSIHWHGIRQLGTNTQDGVNGLSECPLAPGQTQVYTFNATQFGTTWYHSHHTVQYVDGLSGMIVINGPASANYDVDMGPLPVTDWYYSTGYQVNARTNMSLQMAQGPPASDNILIGGMNKDANGNGKYLIKSVTKGTRYLLRLINHSADNNIRVSIDNHVMQVVTVDFVAIKPFYTDNLLLALGQRYEVIIIANQTVGNYWIRADVVNSCLSLSNGAGRAILRYSGAATIDPTTTTNVTDTGCNEPGPLVPWVPNTAGSQALFTQQVKELDVTIALPGTTTNNKNFVLWTINSTAIDIQWEKPILTYVATGNTSYPVTENLIELPNQGVWTYWVLQVAGGTHNPVPVPHPIHLHGHDFYILGKGVGVFDSVNGPSTLNFNNPVRRDTSLLPGLGWMVIAFPTDNPGAWLMHCHIAWHISEGLGVQFLESKNLINLPSTAYYNQCSAFSKWYSTSYYKKDDSGI